MMEDNSLKENKTWLQFQILPAVSLAATLAEYVQERITPSVGLSVWFSVVEMLTVELGRVEVLI